MVPQRFDRLVGSLAAAGTRRRLLSLVAALPLAGTLTTLLVDESAGKGKGKGKAKGKAKSKHAGKLSGGASAQTEKKGVSHCISPNADLNVVYGIAEQIVAAFCPHLNAGQQWRTASVWIVNDTFELVPERFEPAEATPVEDFLAKFSAVKVVIDAGTPQEKTVVFPNDGTLFTGPASLLGGSLNEVLISPITLGKLQPLSVGEHTLELYWVLSDEHCDGLGTVRDDNCLPAGEFFYTSFTFEVIPGHY